MGFCRSGKSPFISSPREATNETRYEGESLYGLAHGKGALIFPNGEKITGRFEYGSIVQGIHTFEQGYYEGTFGLFQDNHMDWDHGTLSLNNGTQYEGSFHKQKYHGDGKLTHPNGLIEFGSFEDGHLSRGKWVSAEKECEGTFAMVDGELNLLEGTLFYKDNDWRYTGPFKENKPHGIGVLQLENRKYKVEFSNGKEIHRYPRRVGKNQWIIDPSHIRQFKRFRYVKLHIIEEMIGLTTYQGYVDEEYRPHGYGKLKTKEGVLLHEGDFEHGEYIPN